MTKKHGSIRVTISGSQGSKASRFVANVLMPALINAGIPHKRITRAGAVTENEGTDRDHAIVIVTEITPESLESPEVKP